MPWFMILNSFWNHYFRVGTKLRRLESDAHVRVTGVKDYFRLFLQPFSKFSVLMKQLDSQ